MITAREAEWMALTLVSESKHPHEWPYLATVIKNRVEYPRIYPNTLRGVVLQPYQFSAYNEWVGHSPSFILRKAREKFGPCVARHHCEALDVAHEVLGRRNWEDPFGRMVFNYWSPRSMVPPGRLPGWNWDILRCFVVSGVDPWRFVFAEEVGSAHPLSSNEEQFNFEDPVDDQDPPVGRLMEA